MKGKSAKVTEVFSSVQGEGPHIGERQIFIRFHGCNMKCAFCDVDKDKKPADTGINKILKEVDELNAGNIHNTVSLTGGEPLLHSLFLTELLPELKDRGLKVYLETNGTLTEELKKIIDYIDIIAVDIKLPSVTKDRPQWQSHAEFLREALKKESFVKVVVSKDTDMAEFNKAVKLVKEIDFDILFVIQPQTRLDSCGLDITAERLLKLQEVALKSLNNVLVIPQAHRMMGVR